MNNKIKFVISVFIVSCFVYFILPSDMSAMSAEDAGKYIAQFSLNFADAHGKDTYYTVKNYQDDINSPRAYAYRGKKYTMSSKVASGEYFWLDCVGWVSMAIHQSLGIGSVDTFTYWAVPTQYPRINQSGFQLLDYSESILKPGDILCNSHHVMVYCGDGKIVHCDGSGPNGTGVHTQDLKSYYDYGAITKIVRITDEIASKIDSSNATTIFDGVGALDDRWEDATGDSGTTSTGKGWIVDPDDKLELFKHILFTEKYNFYKINWERYGHGVESYQATSSSSSSSSNSNSSSDDILKLVQKAVDMAKKDNVAYGSDGRQFASTEEELDAMTKTDCSGFIWSLFKVYLNIDIGQSSDSMKSKAESKHSENGWTAEIHTIGDGELKPGDILYRDGHVGLYVGDKGEKNHVDHGGQGSSQPGPNNTNYENKGTPYTHYIRYTNPNATVSNVPSNGLNTPSNPPDNKSAPKNETEGYRGTFTDSKNRTYKEYKQGYAPWKSVPYWGGNIHGLGCGPTALAIVASGYGINQTPETIAKYMVGNTGFDTLSRALTNCVHLTNTVYHSNFSNKLRENLNSGRPVIVSVGHSPTNMFTDKSHIMAALAINDNSEVWISNPNSGKACGWISLDTVVSHLTYIITIDSDK